MAKLTFNWNPFQTIIDNRIKNEVIKTSKENTRREFVPRYAPFFSRNFSIRKKGTNTPLVLGTDYVFAHTFDRFITKFNRNVFGSVILLKPFLNEELIIDYDTIGGPFVLDENAFIELATGILANPREAQWEHLVNVPTEWPPEPHEHPADQTYDYLEMVTALRSLVIAINTDPTKFDAIDLIKEHIKQPLPKAHKALKEDVGLGDVSNLAPASKEDLKGNSGNLVVTVEILKEALRQFSNNELIP